MAQSRLERIGTIYTRVTALLRSGVMKSEDKPMWYSIYEAFPPKYEPSFDRKVQNVPIKKILYKEDIQRAKFHKDVTVKYAINMTNDNSRTPTQIFLSMYKRMEEEGVPEEERYDKALEEYKKYQTSRETNTNQPRATVQVHLQSGNVQ